MRRSEATGLEAESNAHLRIYAIVISIDDEIPFIFSRLTVILNLPTIIE